MSLSPHSFILLFLFSHLESEHHPCIILKKCDWLWAHTYQWLSLSHSQHTQVKMTRGWSHTKLKHKYTPKYPLAAASSKVEMCWGSRPVCSAVFFTVSRDCCSCTFPFNLTFVLPATNNTSFQSQLSSSLKESKSTCYFVRSNLYQLDKWYMLDLA